MPDSPSKKPSTKPIHEFFRPYLKSTVPAKRSSPPTRGPEEVEPSRRDEFKTRTPKAKERAIKNDAIRTPPSSVLTPASAPGSRASLSIRSRCSPSKDPIEPPSTYKRASIFAAHSQEDDTLQDRANGFSFTDLPSSTQAVVKDGKVIEILDSDEELESLEDLFARGPGRQKAVLSSAADDEAKAETERLRLLSLFTSGRPVPLVGKDKLRALYAKEKAHKFDISALVGDHFDDEEIEKNVRKARADVDAAIQAAEVDSNHKLDKTLLAALATTEDGEHGVVRLLDAVDRTEALASDPVFLFFGVNGLNDWGGEGPIEHPFPKDAIPECLWREGDNDSRSRAYVSGYMADLAANGLISDDALKWTFENVIREQQDDVREAYIRCLRNASSSWTRNNVKPQDVETVFQTLGADSNSLQGSVEIKPRHVLLKEPVRRDPKYLLAALDLFQYICADMDFLALSKLTSIICRLAIDSGLTSDGRISSKIDEILETLLSLPDGETSSHVAERMLDDVGQYLKDATLQAQLLSHILPTSPTALRIRILLAQTFLVGVDNLEETAFNTLQISLHMLAEHVSKSPSFDTRRRKGPSTMDYTALRARTHILDIAISDGGRPRAFSSRADEQSFNKSVDRLADAIQATFVAIVDTGASHMARTECKDVLHALYWRLLYSVRTELRPKRHIFDGKTGRMRDAEEVRVEERGKELMNNFLENSKGNLREGEKRAKQKAEGSSGGEVPKQQDGKVPPTSLLSEPSETEKSIPRQLGWQLGLDN
ncbi:uncharacterized protein A1O5_04724 [Cladophialophora psammophila CBS 110553]|uniref:Uncharacterized protein n=1 Tax=Cladophialophora psammophila CBS 110553 TaxID=1182543 RepID=W9X4H0_9EURO|nr:uncharacterized protein A1O5_04724 [Cladophialophora psammophila CBS 110553]EXJ72220.1 hypothetical protein A1O5_04724 [Cladophialophora psammophila CBS 110553]